MSRSAANGNAAISAFTLATCCRTSSATSCRTLWPVWKDSDTGCRTCCSTCVQCERFQQHSRTQVQQQVQQLVSELVEQHVASVKALYYAHWRPALAYVTTGCINTIFLAHINYTVRCQRYHDESVTCQRAPRVSTSGRCSETTRLARRVHMAPITRLQIWSIMPFAGPVGKKR